MKYKIGDRVKIKSDLGIYKEINGDMSQWEGSVLTIVGMMCPYPNSPEYDYYMMDEVPYKWYEDMIEGLVYESDSAYKELLSKNIEIAFKNTKAEWEEQNAEVQLVYGCHHVNGKIFVWQNPNKIPVKPGHISKVETIRGNFPIIVLGTKTVTKIEADKYKTVIGTYI